MFGPQKPGRTDLFFLFLVLFFFHSFIFSIENNLTFSLSFRKNSLPPPRHQPKQPAPRRPLSSDLVAAPPFPLVGEDGRQVVEVPPHREGALERHDASAPDRRRGVGGASRRRGRTSPPPPFLPAARARNGPQVQEAVPHQRAPVARGEGRGEASAAVVGGGARQRGFLEACCPGGPSPFDAAAELEGRCCGRRLRSCSSRCDGSCGTRGARGRGARPWARRVGRRRKRRRRRRRRRP